jgi:hypothetical protein
MVNKPSLSAKTKRMYLRYLLLVTLAYTAAFVNGQTTNIAILDSAKQTGTRGVERGGRQHRMVQRHKGGKLRKAPMAARHLLGQRLLAMKSVTLGT